MDSVRTLLVFSAAQKREMKTETVVMQRLLGYENFL